ncbi:ferritin-like domain-containing protein [Roseomonas alkaliterrae]|uniref:Rubrerythrin n=1 Tax=Neoroseomonas alkaliterrae TaxID=1452450 RepID=A0A840XQG2_9PROT|nr:ferritin-like domain-containing protein [Neoroseomonas alkaliterrae]MBB5690805.1 rubrerythrin [Neoroseomonas alkaliterrae]MBR0675780.1 ferritin-like domain-containing protein [Neoroseomonas alkaliterrae]
MKHWHIDEVAWHRFDPSRLDPEVVPLVKAAAMVERNAADYVTYLTRVFHDDPDFRAAAEHWGVEETQHGDALGRWGELADPSWNFLDAFARYRAGYKIQLDADASIRGSRSGELIARCMVETGTSSYYTALGDSTDEPVLKEICRLIAADEYRHFKLFYDHLKRYLARENLSFTRRLRVALGRIGESEDDELAYAFHCGNEDASLPYDHDRCIAGYMGRAMGFYRFRHIERGMGMIFKTIGLEPRGRMADIAAKGAWRLLQWRRDRYQAALRRAANENAGAPAKAA